MLPARYTCDFGYAFAGPPESSTASVTCQADGTWTDLPAGGCQSESIDDQWFFFFLIVVLVITFEAILVKLTSFEAG